MPGSPTSNIPGGDAPPISAASLSRMAACSKARPTSPFVTSTDAIGGRRDGGGVVFRTVERRRPGRQTGRTEVAD